MFELLKNECKRFKKWLYITAGINIIFLSFLVYFDDYEHAGNAVGLAYTVLYGFNAFLFGWQQMKTYRPNNMWTYLLNRPAKAQNLCFTLTAAGALILFSSLVLPYVLFTSVVDVIGLYIIDWRHYLQAVYLFLMVLSFYLSACVLTLSNNKTAYSALLFPVLIMAVLLSGGPIISVTLAVVVWLLLMLKSVFKSNLTSHSRAWFQTVVMMVPFHLSAYLVLSASLALGSQVYLMLVQGAGIKTPWNDYFQDNTYESLTYLDSGDQLSLALEDSPDAEYYQRQVAASDVKTINSELNNFPDRQQLPFLQNYQTMSMSDETHGIKWVYSHNSQSFLAQKETSSRVKNNPVKTINQSDDRIDTQVFSEVPLVLGNQLITAQDLYQYDEYQQELKLRFKVMANETLLSGMRQKGQHLAVLSTAALYLFDPLDVSLRSGPIKPLVRLPLPGPYENLSGIALAELMDGNLVSFMFGKLSVDDQYAAEQITFWLDNGYAFKQLAQRELIHGFNALYRHRGYYLSPLVHVIDQSIITPMTTVKPPQPIKSWHLTQLPALIWVWMVVGSLVSLLLAYFVLRKRQITPQARYLQLILVLLTNLSGLLFCWLYYAKQEEPISQPSFE